jgi:hypothetical protein
LVLPGFAPAQECELRKAQDSIFVYACKTSDSKIKSIRAEFVVPATPGVLVAHLLNVPAYTQWQYKMIEARVLKKIGDHELIYQSQVQAPWPVSNRDLIVHLSIQQDAATKAMTFTMKGRPDFVAPVEGVVRVPRSDGKWVVTPRSDGKLQVRYTFTVDPGGSVPVWLLNLSIAEGPFNTFRNLIHRIKTGPPVKPVPGILN